MLFVYESYGVVLVGGRSTVREGYFGVQVFLADDACCYDVGLGCVR